jgi:hypothetical protein
MHLARLVQVVTFTELRLDRMAILVTCCNIIFYELFADRVWRPGERI